MVYMIYNYSRIWYAHESKRGHVKGQLYLLCFCDLFACFICKRFKPRHTSRRNMWIQNGNHILESRFLYKLFESELPMRGFYQNGYAVFAFINRRMSCRKNSVIFCREDINMYLFCWTKKVNKTPKILC